MGRTIEYKKLLDTLKGKTVERPNRRSAGTLSGHAAGEPFEKLVYNELKNEYPENIYKQYELLNDIYLRNPKVITVEERYKLFDSPVALFLLSRGDRATKQWNPNNIFEEKQNDTADIVFSVKGRYDLIDVKTHNVEKKSQPPNIISSYKLAQTCARMIDNNEFHSVTLNYIEVDWVEHGDRLVCTDAHYRSLFMSDPTSLYINWTAGLQIQLHVVDMDQSWKGDMQTWAHGYIAHFVDSAEKRCERMREEYIIPFIKYLK